MIKGNIKGKMKQVIAIATCSMLFGLCGCNKGDDNAKESSVQESSVKENEVEENSTKVSDSLESVDKGSDNGNKGDEKVASASTNLSELLGEWTLIAVKNDGDFELADNFESEGGLEIYEEEGKYKLDYYQYDYGLIEIYGMTLKELSNPTFSGNEKADWYAETSRGRDEIYTYDIVKLTEDTISMHVHNDFTYVYEDTQEEEKYSFDSYSIYAKKDTKNMDDIVFQYRYQNTVTVSNVKELYDAIANNTHIILKEGTYNISQLPEGERNNENLNYYYGEEGRESISWDTIQVMYLNNVFIEGEEGATVKICTEDPSTSPLAFEGCRNVVLKNLTLGHEVEPGYCSGAVVDLYDTYYVDIDHCNLYGSGAYGIQSNNSSNINVVDSDIYECTYGLFSVSNCYMMDVKNCKLRDSSEFTIFDFAQSYGITFENCEITNNHVGNFYNSFINAEDNALTFTKCTFRGNLYEKFSTGSVKLEDCVMEDK